MAHLAIGTGRRLWCGPSPHRGTLRAGAAVGGMARLADPLSSEQASPVHHFGDRVAAWSGRLYPLHLSSRAGTGWLRLGIRRPRHLVGLLAAVHRGRSILLDAAAS